jgi:aminoglycoside phosphotransferase
MVRGVEYINIKNVDSSLRKTLARGLAEFYRELHSVSMDLFDFIGDTRQFSTSSFGLRGREDTLGEILAGEYQNDLERRLDYLDSYRNFDPRDDVLCHNDLHGENFLVADGRLSGVIDFGSVVKRKCDADFAQLLEYDSRLAIMVMEEYEGLAGRKIDIEYAYNLQKIRCYGMLLWFAERNDEKFMEQLKKFVKNMNRLEF